MPPPWLTVVSWVALATAAACAAWITWDLFGNGHRQQMRVMEVVWPVTALYAGPLAVWAYRRFGRLRSRRWRDEVGLDEMPEQAEWVHVALGVSHCGGGCTLGDIVASLAVFWLGLSVAGLALYPEYVADYLAAVVLGVAFQYFAIAPMRGLGLRKGLLQAARADVLSLTAFEVGMFGWMALTQLVLFPRSHLHPDEAAYWFFMQVGMLLGFATAWPANVWLLRHGTKEPM